MKIFNNKIINKNISLTNASNSGNNSINFRKSIVDKNKLNININTNLRNDKYFNNKYSGNKLYLLTDTKDIFNNKIKTIK